MSSSLDRVRRTAGIEVEAGDAAANRHGRPRPSVAAAGSASGRAGTEPDELGRVLSAARGRRVDLTELRLATLLVGLLSLATALSHRYALGWVRERAGDDALFVYGWLVRTLSMWQAHRWAPWTALVVLLTLLVVTVVTDGLRRTSRYEAVPLVLALVLGGLSAIPLLLATALGLIAGLIALALGVALAVAGGMVLWALATAAFE